MSEPEPIGPSIKQATDNALLPLFGDNLPAYYTELERHDAEQRELIDRARQVANELIGEALDRLTFFGGERLAHLGEAHRNTQARREAVEKELHAALVEARSRFNRRVNALIEDAKNGPSE